jgi:hypothetical protein
MIKSADYFGFSIDKGARRHYNTEWRRQSGSFSPPTADGRKAVFKGESGAEEEG